MLLPAYVYSRTNVYVLISQHADGQLIAEVCRHVGIHVVRGSARRGGAQALLQMLRLADKAHLAITPDGPRGPRRQVQPGTCLPGCPDRLAGSTGGLRLPKPVARRSWDRFALPRPWSLGTCVTAEPIRVPADLARSDFEQYRQRIEEEMARASEAAEHLAATGIAH